MATKTHTLTLVGILSLILCSCGGNGDVFKQEIIGQNGEVLVVINDYAKNDTTGGYLRAMLEDTYVGLPADEPIFDMHTVPHSHFDRTMHFFRNLVIVNIADTIRTDTITYYKGQWADNQAIVRVQAKYQENIPAMLKRHHIRIINFFGKAERDRLTQYYTRINKQSITSKIRNKYGVEMTVPNMFTMCTPADTSAMIWLQSENVDCTNGLFVYTLPYTGPESMSKASLLASRDSVLRANVGGPNGSVMCTEHRIEIDYKFGVNRSNGHDVADIRGLWHMDGYMMGGPFLMRAVLDETNNRIVVTDGFVYYPARDKKRNQIRQLEAIMHTLKVDKQKSYRTKPQNYNKTYSS